MKIDTFIEMIMLNLYEKRAVDLKKEFEMIWEESTKQLKEYGIIEVTRARTKYFSTYLLSKKIEGRKEDQKIIGEFLIKTGQALIGENNE